MKGIRVHAAINSFFIPLQYFSFLAVFVIGALIWPAGEISFAAEALPPEYSASEDADEKNLYEKGIWIKIIKSEYHLFVMDGEKVMAIYDVAVGKNKGQKERIGDNKTPEGSFLVQSIHDSSGWSHDFNDGKGHIKGAYGPWFIRLKTPWKGIGIHGTHDPDSIGKDVTEGCIRLNNKDLEELKENYVGILMNVVILNFRK